MRRGYLKLVFLFAGAIVFLFPLFWMFSTSLKTLPEISSLPVRWWPEKPQWSNYINALTYLPFPRYARNTAVIAFFSVIGSVLSASLAGYGFAFYRFPGRDALFMVLLATMMVPIMVRLVPLFIIFQKFGWIDTFLPLIVPSFFGVEALFTFLMRQYYRSLPRDLILAARIDGCNEFAIWWRIMTPLSKPALAAVAIFAFQRVWNDFIPPLVFLHGQEKRTLSLGLHAILTNVGGGVDLWHYAMAIAILVTLPMIIIFILFQKQFIQGAAMSGIKG